MSSRKKSSSTTDDSSSSSSSDSSSSSGTSSASGSGSSSSDSESSSSSEDKPGTVVKNSTKPVENSKTPVKKPPPTKLATEKQPVKQKPPVSRTQRLSKSSVYSSDEANSPTKKPSRTTAAPQPPNQRRKYSASDVRKQQPSHPPNSGVGGGKAPPAVVKQHHQQNFVKGSTANKPPPPAPASKTSNRSSIDKNKSIFSTENSSDSGNDVKRKPKDNKKPVVTKVVSRSTKSTLSAIAKAKATKSTTPAKKLVKKNDSKSCSAQSNSNDDESSSSDGTSTDSDSDDSESTEGSSPLPRKRAATKKALAPRSSTVVDGKSAVILTDSEREREGERTPTKNTIRKLTRSSSTRKSKHLTKKTDTESDLDLDKSSSSKSPDKKGTPTTVTKSKATVKRELKLPSSPTREISPPPEDQKCPVEGCDSSGHLSGNLDKHFMPEACPIYHNMSASECKDRANERLRKKEEIAVLIAQYDQSTPIHIAEQKAYLAKIRDSRDSFRQILSTIGTGERIKTEKDCDNDREVNLTGVAPDYDLQMFREAQAIASEKIEEEVKNCVVGKGIKYITMGKYQMKVWYQSPYPDDTSRLPKMYICEYCLRYQKSETSIKRHAAKCVWRHPPGDEIYRKGKLQVWQVDGKRHKQYCQHLCLLAKFFLDHKTLYYDVEPFLFYVMTLADTEGCHTVGYFSKEKNSFYNVSCILTLPPYQRKGYGRLLIDFSYLLTRVENKIGSPEKPLSDLGLISYRSYWKDVLLDFLCTRTGTTLTIKDISQEMAIYSYDIVSTLQALGMMKYWKGKHIVLKKQDVLEEFEERRKPRGNLPKIDPACLRWIPFVPTQALNSS